MASPREVMRERGWTVEHVPHEEIARYNACYRVEYDGKLIHPPAADDLGIPRNEIWVSEKWSKYDRFILYHELREIEHRADGHDVTTAHELAERDERSLWRDNPRWRVMNAEWDEGRAHLPFPHEWRRRTV
ncbi:competence protein ComEA [Halorubrum xinjiangense]|uniref:Competence protein ComEA n=1 Tax=Halorubrum xinjiangense TaxID=261291 RepID=A0A1G7L332_9EURY|nr:hypothetical protein [Halorubrum xinjiangense]SDF43781.1 competence protein ComEA [Halorubrum xinjiangense]